jgi:hypothetical protein
MTLDFRGRFKLRERRRDLKTAPGILGTFPADEASNGKRRELSMFPKSFFATALAMCMTASTASIAQDGKDKDASAASKRIQDAIDQLAKGSEEWRQFSLTYTDLHGLHGGLTLTIHGDGKVTQESVHEKVGEEKEVLEAELKQLVELLQKHRAWEQKEVERPAVPCESTARLVIKYGDDSVTVWEWYNDLPKNKRLVEIREAMKKAAWKSVPKE